MKFVALISGGKDSFFNILHCQANGHELVALANLHPADPKREEIDSFMFQTVGHSVIDYYKECVGVPLYKKAIYGCSTNVELEYLPTRHDEIEDLFCLLQEVKNAHPDVEGVSCGAILSHYQRTRVENVCGRLGLTSLAYLWQLNQTELMRSMCELGLDARLVKVAAIGLTEKHLGKLIQEMFPILIKLNQMYDVHVCGEGGEFETLVLDAPFFVKKLHIKSLRIVAHSSDVSYIADLEIELVDKEKTEYAFSQPPLLLEEFVEAKSQAQQSLDSELENGEVEQAESTLSGEKLGSTSSSTAPTSPTSRFILPRVFPLASRVYISNVVSDMPTIESQTNDIMMQIGRYLAEHGATFDNVQHMSVLVLDMNNFARFNNVYGTYLTKKYLPPSRACVETTLPLPHKVQVSCVMLKPPSQKIGIHIRSRSYWAPQNIGPYSQAIMEQRSTFKTATLSGQIPLVPASMALSTGTPLDNAVLSLQHIYRAKALVGVRQIAYYTCYITESTTVPVVAKVWNAYVDGVENGQDFFSRLLIVQTTGLPRGADVEWGGIATEKVVNMYEDEKDVEPDTAIVTLSKNFKTTVARFGEGYAVKMVGNDLVTAIEFLRSPALASSHVSFMSTLDNIHKLSNMGLSAEWTPVLGVWDSDGTKYDFGMVWVS